MTSAQLRSGIFRTKSVEQSIADTDEPATKLRRELGALDLTVFGVSVLIGAGIFAYTAEAAGDKAGPATAVAFVLAAIACGFAGMCYAEFASTVPVAGSAYTFSYATFGEFIAWIIGWDLVLEYALGASVVAKSWSKYLGQVLALLGVPIDGPAAFDFGFLQFDCGALLVIVGITTVLALCIKLSSRVSVLFTTLKVLIVLFVIVLGLFYVKGANYTPFFPPSKPGSASSGGGSDTLLQFFSGNAGSSFGVFGLLAAASLVFFAFIGFDAVSTTAEETRNPQKDLPRGILGSLLVVTILYVLTSLVLAGMVPYQELSTDQNPGGATLATAFKLLGVNWAAGVVSVGALFGLTTVSLVLMLGQTRVMHAMSRDGLVPRGLAKTGGRGTPIRITLIVGVACALIAGFFPAGDLEQMTNIGTLFAFVLVSIGTAYLRRNRPDLPRSFRTPALPVVAVLAVISCLWLMINLSVETWIRFIVWMIVGFVVYFFYSRSHSVLGRRERGETIEALAPVDGGADRGHRT